MKYKLFFLLIVFSISINYAQNISGKVTYVVSMEPFSDKWIDSISKNNPINNAKMNAWAKNRLKNTPDVEAYLVFKNGEALYKLEEEMQNDGRPDFNINRIFAGGVNKYYKNTNTKEFFFENNLGELLLTDIAPKEWQITQESKQIGDYVCFKAIDLSNKKKTTFVWFTPQIPVSFGPLDYNGLPGLVILVEMKKRTISASKIVLNPKKEIKIEKPTKGRKETIEEYNKRVSVFIKFLHEKD